MIEKRLQEKGSKSGIMITQFYYNILEYIFFRGEYLAAGKSLFIRELVENKTVVIGHVTTDKQLVNIFTKTLDASRFVSLRKIL